jgi:hypothetical protein
VWGGSGVAPAPVVKLEEPLCRAMRSTRNSCLYCIVYVYVTALRGPRSRRPPPPAPRVRHAAARTVAGRPPTSAARRPTGPGAAADRRRTGSGHRRAAADRLAPRLRVGAESRGPQASPRPGASLHSRAGATTVVRGRRSDETRQVVARLWSQVEIAPFYTQNVG